MQQRSLDAEGTPSYQPEYYAFATTTFCNYGDPQEETLSRDGHGYDDYGHAGGSHARPRRQAPKPIVLSAPRLPAPTKPNTLVMLQIHTALWASYTPSTTQLSSSDLGGSN